MQHLSPTANGEFVVLLVRMPRLDRAPGGAGPCVTVVAVEVRFFSGRRHTHTTDQRQHSEGKLSRFEECAPQPAHGKTRSVTDFITAASRVRCAQKRVG
jgi:hypothetical protein